MDKTSHFFITLVRFFYRSIVNVILLLVIGGLTCLLSFQFVNNFTDSSDGVNNIIILISAMVFFPLLNSFFVMFLIQENRKNKKKFKFNNKSNLEAAE